MEALLPGSVIVSARTEHGMEPLRDALRTRVQALRPATELRVPASDGRLLADIHRSGEVVEQRADGEELVLVARLDPVSLARVVRAGAIRGAP
jgi:GTP-binding protein HflX